MCGFLGVWYCQRPLRLAFVPLDGREHRSTQAGLGSGFRLVVDDSRSVLRRCRYDGKIPATQRIGLDEAKQISGISRERNSMSDYQQKIAETFNERKRLNQLRKRKEKLRFWNELRVIPRWLFVLVTMLYVLALVIALTVNMSEHNNPNGNDMFPP